MIPLKSMVGHYYVFTVKLLTYVDRECGVCLDLRELPKSRGC